ncbi:MAG: class I SAM-dependent rRNA methyltransferase [Caldilineaceae bacterium]
MSFHSDLLTAIPAPATRRLALHVTRDAERVLRGGHPWLFANSIVRQSHVGSPGDLAVVFDQKRRFLAIGLYDPTSPLRVRILHQGAPVTIDRAWWRQQVSAAIQRRAPLLRDGQTTGYRLVHGENDGLPGLVVDRYDQTLVLKLYTAAWLLHLADFLPELLAAQPAQRLVLRMSRALQKEPALLYGLSDGMVLWGPALSGPVIFTENGLRFEADPLHGQKTGFFLDQRENRARVEALATGRRVLNVFAYNGGFSLYAARGGAHLVTSLDSSSPALEAAARNFALNQTIPTVAQARHELLVGDAFQLLPEMAAAGARFDLVILDPPAFAKQQAEIERALSAYAQLARLGVALLQPGGTLVFASCSSRVGIDAFTATVQQAAALAGRPLHLFAQTTHALDHPIGFPEGAYLKCLYATA